MSERKIPAGIEQLLGIAAVDEAFASELRKDRAALIEKSGLSLSPTERALLATIDATTLETMIASVRKNLPDTQRRAFLSMAANVALGLAGGGALASSLTGCIDRCVPTKGIQPDRPPKPAPPTGSRPDRPAPKTLPSSQPSRAGGGVRADRPIKPAFDYRSVGKGGVRADRPKKKILDEE